MLTVIEIDLLSPVLSSEMANGDDTYTQALSRAIDAAYGAYRQGESEAETKLHQAFSSQARNFVSYRLRAMDDHLAHDIASRAMLAVADFRGECELSTWFYTLARNETNRELRRLIRDRKTFVSLDIEGGMPGASEVANIAADSTSGDPALHLEKLKKRLSLPQFEVMRLKEEGHSLQDIARITRRPIGTIRSQYRLAKDKMKQPSEKQSS